jgi:hypothetical protein
VQEKSSHIFFKAALTSNQDLGFSRVTFGMVEIIPKVSHRELPFRMQARCNPMEVKIVTDDLMPWPLSDEWIDIGGEG